MAMRIYLIGYMASGKSKFGRLLAQHLGYAFRDLDNMFEERFRISISDFFEKYDETAFRHIEHMLLLETTELNHIVIATGGGTPCFFNNMEIIKNAGFSLYLQWNETALSERLKLVKRKRPLLKDTPVHELAAKVHQHLQVRNPFYLQADHVLQADGQSMESLMEQIMVLLSHRSSQG